MRQKKCLKELTIRDNFMFGAVMSDAETLLSGSTYGMLPDSYIIFICDFDPFGEKKYRYTFENRCLENPNLGLGSGERTLFLSTAGENEEDEPEELVQFLKYVKADLEESESSLKKSINHI